MLEASRANLVRFAIILLPPPSTRRLVMSGCSLSMLCDVHSHHTINSALAFKKAAVWQVDLHHIAQPCI